MKVVYKKTIFEKVMEKIDHAKKFGKEIEKIILNESEWDQMFRENMYGNCMYRQYPQGRGYVMLSGVRVEKEIFPNE